MPTRALIAAVIEPSVRITSIVISCYAITHQIGGFRLRLSDGNFQRKGKPSESREKSFTGKTLEGELSEEKLSENLTEEKVSQRNSVFDLFTHSHTVAGQTTANELACQLAKLQFDVEVIQKHFAGFSLVVENLEHAEWSPEI